MKLTLAFTILFPVIAFSQGHSGQSFSLQEFNTILNRPVEPQVDCFDPKETPPCADINRTYCGNLALNNGRISDSSGSVNLGKSEKSMISELERANLVNLIRSLPLLPEDLRSAVVKPMARLSSLIEKENDSRDWYRDVSRVRAELAEKIQDVAERRASVSLPGRLSPGQRATKEDKAAEKNKHERDLMDAFARAKMESTPNWARIKMVLTRVKQDMLSVLETLPLTPEEKQERINKVNETKLTTPFGVRIGGVIGQIMEQDCRTNMVNAMYLFLNGTLTVCAGFVNGFQSESSLYFTLAHELAHSFNLNFLQNANSNPRWRQFNERLVSTNGNIPCSEYEQFKAQSRTAPQDYSCGRESYNNFMSCLTNITPSDLPPQGGYNDVKALEKVNFCSVTDPKQGLAFMNPDEFADRNMNRLVSSVTQELSVPAIESSRIMLAPAYEIVQEKRCHPEKPCSETYESARVRAMMGTTPPACLRISQRGQENEADWYAHKAMTMRLRSVTDIRQRRELVAASMGVFCGFSYSRVTSDKDKLKIEKELERLIEAGEIGAGEDNHAPSGHRISAAMTDEIASLLQCTKEKDKANAKPSYQSCRL